MLVYTRLKPKDIRLYHEKNWKPRTKTNEYKKLRKHIKEHGILDPILVQDFPAGLRIEIGEQRLLISRELKIDELEAFVYNKCQPNVSNTKGLRILEEEELIKYFRNEDIPCYKTIRKYLDSKIIQLVD